MSDSKKRSVAGLKTVKGVDLLALREKRLAGEPASKDIPEKPETLTAEQYLRRQFIRIIPDESDEVPHVKLMWRRVEDKKGRARVNLYSKREACITRSFFVHIWPSKDGWQHEVIVPPATRRNYVKDL